MRYWISGEVEADIADSYRRSAVLVRNAIDALTSRRNYGAGLDNWDLIGIAFQIATPGFGEVRRYKRRTKSVEFRLQLDHSRFVHASSDEQCNLVFALVMRSLAIARSMNIDEFDFDTLEHDLKQVGLEHGWIGGPPPDSR